MKHQLRVALLDLIETCQILSDKNVPHWDEEGGGHWSSTLDNMRDHLGRTLTPSELTALSLSRCYGPMPVLDDADPDGLVVNKIWSPEKTKLHNCGHWLEWDELEKELVDVYRRRVS